MAMERTAKPLLRALAGEPVWPPPIWLMRQAGRYLPEYRALRAKAADFIALCTTPELAAEVTLQPIRRYRLRCGDPVQRHPDVPWALGQVWNIAKAKVRCCRRCAMRPISGAGPERSPTAIAPILETVRRVRSGLTKEGFADCALIGFAGAPFTVACYMVEGGGSRDFAATRTWPTLSRSCSIG